MPDKDEDALCNSDFVQLEHVSGMPATQPAGEVDTEISLYAPEEVSPTALLSPETTTGFTRTGLIRTILVTAVLGVSALSNGLSLGYVSPAITDLFTHPDPRSPPSEEVPWIACLYFVSAAAGGLVAAPLADRLGRKKTLMLVMAPLAAGWIVMVAAQSGIMLVAGRMLLGFAGFAGEVATGAYVTEVCPPHMRGLFTSLGAVTMNVGVLFVYVIRAYVRWSWLAVACLLPIVPMAVLLSSLPESPHWLVMRNRVEEASVAMSWWRDGATAEAIQREVSMIESSLRSSSTREVTPVLDLFRPPLRKYVAVSLGLANTMCCSGLGILSSFTVAIFKSSRSHLDPQLQTIVVGAIFVAGSIACTFLIERFSRRGLLMSSWAAMVCGWQCLGSYFFVLDTHKEFAHTYLYWLPLFSMSVIVFGGCSGAVCISGLMVREIFPTRARARACSLSAVAVALLTFASSQVYLLFSSSVANYGSFFMCALVCVHGVVFTYFCVPETRGLSLEEIQRQLKL